MEREHDALAIVGTAVIAIGMLAVGLPSDGLALEGDDPAERDLLRTPQRRQ